MDAALLALKEVAKSFPSPGKSLIILESVSLEVRGTQTLAISGPSGSGKSTLLGLMAALERPDSGEIFFRGQSMRGWDEDALAAWRSASVGFIFQNFGLIPSLTALENVSLPLEILGWGLRAAAKRAAEILDELGLNGRHDHFPSQLSGGEQQRVAIGRAYAHSPALILADEPTGSLDRDTAEKVLGTLLNINSAKKTALVVVTHDDDIASRMGRRLLLNQGRIVP
ncbi:MAG: hypothetical protein A3G41_08320 [Elusimicrobia bacterium RIFCSPLOWO2_12_FULL_59_9]|nr:MAG: hypothetical protein A3G41_08320 [Elusimicrobia bacterium RIFCSPLOWO2_12_FULL_59_9]